MRDKDTISETEACEESWAPHIHESATTKSAICRGFAHPSDTKKNTRTDRQAPVQTDKQTHILNTHFLCMCFLNTGMPVIKVDWFTFLKFR